MSPGNEGGELVALRVAPDQPEMPAASGEAGITHAHVNGHQSLRNRLGLLLAVEIWDDRSWPLVASQQVAAARQAGAIGHLVWSLQNLA